MSDENTKAADDTEDVEGHLRHLERPDEEGIDSGKTEPEPDDDVEGHVVTQKFPGIEGRTDSEPR
jgi:hypothetical protein